jgi:voltage-gated sodium channel
MFFIAVILVSGVVVGLDSYPSVSAKYGTILHAMDSIILWLFVFEILLKMCALGSRFPEFFNDGWNAFDFIIVSACFLPFEGQSIIVLRLLRVLRIVRLVGTVPELKLIVNTLLKSMPSMGYIAALLSIVFYIYARLGTFLFRVATLEDWTDIMYTAIYGCQSYGYWGKEELCKSPEAFLFLGWLYFVSFVLLATFVFLNLIIGVIINNMEDLKEEERLRLDPELEKLGNANIKILFSKIKKDVTLLETHISFLDVLEQKRLKDD